MTSKYHHYSDVKVSVENDQVKWVDYGEIRKLDPDEALWLARQLAAAAVEAEAN